jgi:hypothetical protein
MQSILELRVPRSHTALMQHLQSLVIRGHLWWCGGTIRRDKLPAFAEKMAVRYPLLRNTRARGYDRSKGLAAVHLVTIPQDGQMAFWWLFSSEGTGGLNDPASLDVDVAKHAMAADGHVEYRDYVLLYATKKELRELDDKASGEKKQFFKDTSTWTWKVRQPVYSEMRAQVDHLVSRLALGEERRADERAWGLRGYLEVQRGRPLFSGVRNQVIELHRYAEDRWAPSKRLWLNANPQLANVPGAGALRSIADVVAHHLPKKPLLPVYGTEAKTLSYISRIIA